MRLEGLTGALSSAGGRRAGIVLWGATGGGGAWGWFEAGWVRLDTLDVPVARLPEPLHGLRIAHLSDFPLGARRRGRSARARAVEWSAGRDPDLVVVSGDLLSSL